MINMRETLMLQKSRMLQMQGVNGEAVVVYADPLTTQQMRYPRLSRRVINVAFFRLCWTSPAVDSLR